MFDDSLLGQLFISGSMIPPKSYLEKVIVFFNPLSWITFFFSVDDLSLESKGLMLENSKVASLG